MRFVQFINGGVAFYTFLLADNFETVFCQTFDLPARLPEKSLEMQIFVNFSVNRENFRKVVRLKLQGFHNPKFYYLKARTVSECIKLIISCAVFSGVFAVLSNLCSFLTA